MILRPGDLFCSKNPMALGRLLNAVQKFWSKDNESTYSHSGIILDRNGKTFEALWKIKSASINDYNGEQVLIGRHKNMGHEIFLHCLAKVVDHQGDRYPFHRLFFHLFPPMAKYINFNNVVCSELAAKFLCGGAMMTTWKGQTPDNIADMIRTWKNWEIVFEGRWDENIIN